MTRYVLGSSQKEIDRLNIQSALFAKETAQTLNLAGVKEGMRCLDAGCGIGHTTMLISDRVGDSGKRQNRFVVPAQGRKSLFVLYFDTWKYIHHLDIHGNKRSRVVRVQIRIFQDLVQLGPETNWQVGSR